MSFKNNSNENCIDESSPIKRLLNIMFIKRFALPSHININNYNNNFLCDNFNHISCFLYWKFTWIEDG